MNYRETDEYFSGENQLKLKYVCGILENLLK